MESLPVTKRRLLREAVRHNVEQPRRTARRAIGRPGLVLAPWLASACFVASLVYLSLPPGVLVRVQAASAATSAAAPADSPAEDGGPAREPRGGPAPRRLERAVLPLSVKTIVLDPGHGGAHTGAVSSSGVTEKEIALDIALRLRRLLEGGPVQARLTREADVTMSLGQRVAFANAHRADLFVSIHVNWIPHPGARPLETYYVGPTDDPAALRLAGLENRDSGYSLAAYRRLLERIYLDVRRDESHALARTINGTLYRSLREVNPGLANRGVKMAPFAVLVGTEMPAVLVEVSCLSNDEEVALLTKADYRDRIAEALLRGIRSYANELNGGGRREG